MSTKSMVAAPGRVVHRWEALMPGNVPHAEDAYSHLSEADLRQLACLARARWLSETGRDGPDRASAREAARIERAFAQRGWDAEWLLAQREAVRQQRVQRSYNPEVEGRRAELTGLVLPLDWNASGRFTRFLLTPELGECSHEPPPPHSQVVYIESRSPIDIVPGDSWTSAGELRLSVAGSIRFAASSHRAFLVDGLMRVDASYAIEPDGIELARAPWEHPLRA
jgi:hypothetical protein